MIHTQGPWETHKRDDGVWNIIHWGPIAFVGDNGNGSDNTEANANLISASPDMLYALEELVGEFDLRNEELCARESGTIGYPDTYGIQVARDAIKKARGK